jgi:hypothetical protein
MCVISEPKCAQFWEKCLHEPHVPHAAFSSSAGTGFKVFGFFGENIIHNKLTIMLL